MDGQDLLEDCKKIFSWTRDDGIVRVETAYLAVDVPGQKDHPET